IDPGAASRRCTGGNGTRFLTALVTGISERSAGGTNADVQIDNQLSEADERAIVGGLLAFNEKWLGPSNDQSVHFVARDELGVVGGLLGHTRWKWLYVAKLWVDERARGRGIGTKLLNAAE